MTPTDLPNNTSVTAVGDAVRRIHGHKCWIEGLVPVQPGRTAFGPAATVRFVPLRKDVFDAQQQNFGRLFYEALGDDPSGKVLVMSSEGLHTTSLGGGTKLARAQFQGLSGVVTDGSLRDFDEFKDYDFGAWCHGPVLEPGPDHIMPYEANGPVVIRGVTVLPGDHIVADDTGAVVIPSASLDEVLEEAAKIEDEDAAWIKKIRDEDPATVRAKGSGEW